MVATAKRDLKAGEMLDGEGGYTVWGKLFPAEKSLAHGGLPLGLAHDVKLLQAGGEGPVAQVERRGDGRVARRRLRLRREMEAQFAGPKRAAA